MKYMTFNRSCSYAGIANLLEEYNFHYEDHEIIKALSIPYLFLYLQQEDCYAAGAMIQSQPWFNYFLNSLGFDFIEERFNPQSAVKYFDKNEKRCMLGIVINANSNSKHTVVFEGKENEKYRFLNPKRKDSIEPDHYVFNKDELNKKLPPNFPMGYLVKNQKIVPFDVTDQLLNSLHNIDEYQNKLVEFCSKEQGTKTLIEARDTLFAPLLLDVLAMMELIGEVDLVTDIKNIRAGYMKAMKETQAVLLSDYIALEYLNDIILRYKEIILDYIVKYKTILNIDKIM
jgi:hypothetical protein